MALLGLALLGEAVSVYLTYAHHRIHDDGAWASACNLGRTINCDLALTSAYAVAGGIPLSMWGAWFYALLLLAVVPAFISSPSVSFRYPALAVFGASAIGVGVSIALAALSSFVLKSVCLLCLTLYLVNVVLMFVARRAASESGEAARGGWSVAWRNRFLQALIAVGLVSMLVGRSLYARYSPGGSDVCQTLAETQRRGVGQSVTIEVYSDFQCPHCRKLDRQLQELIDRPGLHVILEHYPLDAGCNTDVTTTWHPGACLQARAAICATAFGAGPEMRTRLFAEAPSSLPRVVELAAASGLDAATFEACVMTDAVFDRLKASIARARSFGVKATPTLIINGRSHVGTLSSTSLKCLVKASGSPQ